MTIIQKVTDRVLMPYRGIRVKSGGGGAAADWWDPNNVGLSTVAAYRAINSVGTPWPGGPANYAATLVDLSGNGNNLVNGNGAVPWVQVIGWQFLAAGLQWLDTGVTALNTNWSMFCQFANVGNLGNFFVTGAFSAGRRFYLSPRNFATVIYGNGGFLPVGPVVITGNLGFGDSTSFRNGINDGAIPGGLPPAFDVYIGALNNTGVAGSFITADVESLVIYDDATVAQVQAQAANIVVAMGQL